MVQSGYTGQHTVWSVCVNIFIMNELHKEQEYYWVTKYRAGAAVVSTITSVSISDPFPHKINIVKISYFLLSSSAFKSSRRWSRAMRWYFDSLEFLLDHKINYCNHQPKREGWESCLLARISIEMVIKAFTNGGPPICHGKTKNLTAKTKYLTAKPKTSRQKQKPHGKNKIPHDKTKNLTAKPKTSRQNQILHSKNQIPHGKSKYPRQNQSYFVFAVKYLVLPWGFWFCREVFCFCREVFGFAVRYFVFAVRFLVSPWCFCFWHEVFRFAVTVVGHHSFWSRDQSHFLAKKILVRTQTLVVFVGPWQGGQTWEVACRPLFDCFFFFFFWCVFRSYFVKKIQLHE